MRFASISKGDLEELSLSNTLHGGSWSKESARQKLNQQVTSQEHGYQFAGKNDK